MTVVTDAQVPVAVEVQSPQTVDSALRGFRRKVKAMKKGRLLAGQIERKLASESKTLLREAAREALQAQANGCSPHCPLCGAKLQNVEPRERVHISFVRRGGARGCPSGRCVFGCRVRASIPRSADTRTVRGV